MFPIVVVAALALGAPVPAPAAPIERVVAVVEDELVLLSDVRIEEALHPLDASPSLLWARHDVDATARAVESAMLRTLAGDVALYHPTEEALTARLDAVRAAAGSAEGYAALLDAIGLDEAALRAAIRRRMVAEAYARRNVQARQEDDPAGWRSKCDAMIEDTAERLRIRRIPEPT